MSRDGSHYLFAFAFTFEKNLALESNNAMVTPQLVKLTFNQSKMLVMEHVRSFFITVGYALDSLLLDQKCVDCKSI